MTGRRRTRGLACNGIGLPREVARFRVEGVIAATNPRVGSQIADLQAELIEITQGQAFTHWRFDVIALVQLLDQDGPPPY